MIKKLQTRFILITMTCIGAIFLLILLSLNFFMTAANYRQGYHMLTDFANRNPGSFLHTRWINDMRIFQLSYDSEQNFLGSHGMQNPNLTEEDLQSMGSAALQRQKEKGRISDHLYLVRETEEGISIYFLDYSPEKSMSAQLLKICSWVGLAGMLILFIPVLFLSRWVTRPVQTAFDKQKQFIADASHELKTPLAIITASAEVMETSMPENKWLLAILEQSSRMKTLIASLLDLARLDSGSHKQSSTHMDLSQTVRNASLSFESIAYEQDKKYTMEIENSLFMQGCESQISQLVTILLDNAFKYTDNNGSVLISLSKQNGKNQLLVRNTGKGIEAKDQKHIFERFYRSDSSRSRESGGYGLGLSIAESIVKFHQGDIRVKSDEVSYTEFEVLLP